MSDKHSNSKIRGFAMQALRAFIKALELEDGDRVSKGKYRYDLPENADKARIFVLSTGETVPGYERSIEELAKIGKQVRLARIGLIDAKIAYDDEARQCRQSGRFIYTYNLITGEATIVDRNGESVAELPSKQRELLSSAKVEMNAPPTTIEGWAVIGRQVEKYYFDGLKAAQEYGSDNGVKEFREAMIARSIIRAPREDKSQS